MKLRNIFKSRGKPVKDRTSGSFYTFFMGGSTAGKNVNERSTMLYYCQTMEEAVFSKVSTVNSGAFNNCSNLTKIDLGGAITRLSSAFMTKASKVSALILSGVTTVPTLGTSAFTSSTIKSGTGYVYVPKELEATLKVASKWSTYGRLTKTSSKKTMESIVNNATSIDLS